jgi:hypothetical protein
MTPLAKRSRKVGTAKAKPEAKHNIPMAALW